MNTIKKILIIFTFSLFTGYFFTDSADAASVIANINGNPVTDADITARVKLMTMTGEKSSTSNRVLALSHIIDDYVKIAHAEKFRATPDDADVTKELKRMQDHFGAFDSTTRAMATASIRAQIAWQIVIGRTIMPTITVGDDEIAAERNDLERTRGLPYEMTFIRLIDIPADVAAKLTKPKSCDDAMLMAENLGGAPQKVTAIQYELSEDIRTRTVGLPLLAWSKPVDGSVILLCAKKKTAEYKNLDDIIKQNAVFKRASFKADQQLKQLRRKAVVIINEPAYNGALD